MQLLDWRESNREMACFPDSASLRRGMLALADRLGPRLLGMGVSPRAWSALGIRVAERPLKDFGGYCELRGRERIVVVNSADHRRRQRFTVAHELAHLLMADVDRAAITLSLECEERLCDEFAGRLLVPAEDLSRLLARLGGELADVLAISARYGVSLSVALAASGDWWVGRREICFAASVRGHPERPEEIAPRAYKARCGEYLIPDHVRLDSLGLRSLSADLASARPPTQTRGRTPAAAVRLWRPNAAPRSGEAAGPARWECMMIRRAGIALIKLNVGELGKRWATPRRQRVSRALAA